MTILIVDDSASIRRLLEATLRLRGHLVAAAEDGEVALKMLHQQEFGLVVLDINMPHMDGLTLLQTVRRQPQWAALPILMLTTEDDETIRSRALALGATDYMMKPFKPTELLQRVGQLLGQ